ncbi:hypothetical protein GIB67_006975 [Kingdonia uniflora]|uniref:Cyclin N-terminal domain-containing protein n=1 Tax=Kingdonia uniflora TaxID=39325 RepID=A0A7J7NZR2_9MAGN|nr:hypothetical protein GIB67_006975 [Kingdonia uniflora]
MQLLDVACVSLAAKMEEIEVPLSVDLQVEEYKFIIEAKTIQRMELLVLSTLKWRMRAVTPFTFMDYFFQITAVVTVILEEGLGLFLPSSNTGCVAEFSCGADLKRNFGRVSFIGAVIGLRYFIVVDVVVFLVLSVIDLEFRMSIRGAHFCWGAVWTVSSRLSFRGYRQTSFIFLNN